MEPEIRHAPVRYVEIDLLRFIAAMSVVLFHYTYFGYHQNNLNPVEYSALGEIFKYGYLGVELFFLISGYVVLVSAQDKTLSQFFISRVTRLYPAFWVACTLCFLVVRLFGPAVHTLGWSDLLDAPFTRYAYSMTMLQSFLGKPDLDGVYWTLSVELIFYFLIGLLIAFKWIKHLVPLLTLWLVGCIVAGTYPGSAPFTVLFFPTFAPFFIAGMVLYLLQTKQAPIWKLAPLLAVAYVVSMRNSLAMQVHTEQAFKQSFSSVVVLSLMTSCFVVMLLIIYRKINFGKAAWLSWAGALTYPIYLLHDNMGYVAFQRLHGHVDKYALLAVILLTLIFTAYLLHTLIERRFRKPFGQKIQQFLAWI